MTTWNLRVSWLRLALPLEDTLAHLTLRYPTHQYRVGDAVILV
jgi:hypothetical protein